MQSLSKYGIIMTLLLAFIEGDFNQFIEYVYSYP